MSDFPRRRAIGAEVQPDGSTHFRVWAPEPREIALRIETPDGTCGRCVALEREPRGYYSARVDGVGAGTPYRYVLDGDPLPDPASRWQPDGPFGPSVVVDPSAYAWKTMPTGTRLAGQVIYEMHPGTFTAEGTWHAAIEKLPQLMDSGITTIEVMPVADFPGRFGWGYDGVYPYAPAHQYGTPDDLRAFVDAGHAVGLNIILDVVYNHLGPDGCVFARYARSYYSNAYSNEWGDALNFDGPGSLPVREYFVQNAAYWIDEFRFDGLRLDATQTIHDRSPRHMIAEIGRAARQAAGRRPIILVAESETQTANLVRPADRGGCGLDAVWNDDFHHSAVVAVTGRKEAYYSDHHGTPQELISSAKYGYLFQGQRYGWQKKTRGTRATDVAGRAFVTYIENHDQLANSGGGARLRLTTSPGRYRALTALMMLMPGTPMLFQGQEFGASTPFLFFADHNPQLAEAVQKGRAEFVAQFPSLASKEMQACLPPPHDVRTFERCKLDWRERDANGEWVRLFRDLAALRRGDDVFRAQDATALDGAVLGAELFLLRWCAERPGQERLLLVNFGAEVEAQSFAEPLVAPPDDHEWRVRWSTEHPDYGGCGTPAIVSDAGWRVPAHAAVVLQPAPATRES